MLRKVEPTALLYYYGETESLKKVFFSLYHLAIFLTFPWKSEIQSIGDKGVNWLFVRGIRVLETVDPFKPDRYLLTMRV